MKNFNNITTFFLVGLILVSDLLILLALLSIYSYGASFSGVKCITMLFSGAVGIAAFARILKKKLDSIFLVKLFCFLCVICLPYYLFVISYEIYYFFILTLLIMPTVCFFYFQGNPDDIEEIMPAERRKSTLIDKLLVVVTVILGLLSLAIYLYSKSYNDYLNSLNVY